MLDLPKSLGDETARSERRAELRSPHVAPLTAFVERIRRERRCGDRVPYCDPADGGIEAECLFVLEAPGPKAVLSGFISRNNPDESAKNWFELNDLARIPRKRTITWNIVPWFICVEHRIRAATRSDIEEGWPYLLALLDLLPQVTVAVLVGRKAQRVSPRLAATRPNMMLINCPHPSPMFVNRKPENRGQLLKALREVAERLK
jgi:uracil-DNA glycosylase